MIDKTTINHEYTAPEERNTRDSSFELPTQNTPSFAEAVHRTWMKHQSSTPAQRIRHSTTSYDKSDSSPARRDASSREFPVSSQYTSFSEEKHSGKQHKRDSSHAPVGQFPTTVSYTSKNDRTKSQKRLIQYKVTPARTFWKKNTVLYSDFKFQSDNHKGYDGRGFKSNTLMYDHGAITTRTLHVSPAEVIILLSFFLLWFFAIGLFISKWRRFKLVEPRDVVQQKPKNLESVKVVQRSSDSVIYNSYPEAITRNMELREKRLQRMRTLPAIKVNPEQKSPAAVLRRDLNLPNPNTPPMLIVHRSDCRSDDEEAKLPSATEKYPMLAKMPGGLLNV